MSRRKTGFSRKTRDTSFIVYYDSDNGEYSVRVSVDTGTSHHFDPDRTYFTSDNDDAELTCVAMWKEEQRNQVATSDNADIDILTNRSLLKALKHLEYYATRVEKGLCDQDTGWYYQFGAAIEKARNAISEAEK